MSLRSFTFGEIAHRPARTLLTVLSSAIGVAAVVAVAVAASTVRQSFEDLCRVFAGKANFEITSDLGGRFPQDIAAKVQEIDGVLAASPILESPIVFYVRGKRVQGMLLAVDPKLDAQVGDYRFKVGKFSDPDEPGITLPSQLAARLKLELGDPVKLLTRRGVVPLPITGLFEPESLTWQNLQFLLMPLDEAQQMFRASGEISSIRVLCAPDANPETVRTRIALELSPGLTVRDAMARTEATKETLLSFNLALQLASGLSLVVSFFIILNAFLMNVAERRKQLGILRLIGATRKQVVRLVLWEGMLLGLLGAVLGVPLGLFGARSILSLLEAGLQTPLVTGVLHPGPIMLGVVTGAVTAALAAYIPARQAGRVGPLQNFTTVEADSGAAIVVWLGRAGVAIGVIASLVFVGCIKGLLPAEGAIAATLLALVAVVSLLFPAAPYLFGVAAGVTRRWHELEVDLALEQLLCQPIRTGLTMAVLFVAVATSVGIGNSVLNNLASVRTYVDRTVAGDFIVKAMNPDLASGLAADLPDELPEKVRALPEVRSVDVTSLMLTRIEEKQVLVLARSFPPSEKLSLNLYQGDPQTVHRQLAAGEVVLGNVLARRLGKRIGDEVELTTTQGRQKFKIAGIAEEFASGGMILVMDLDVARQKLGLKGSDSLMIHARPGEQAALETELSKITDDNGLILQSIAEFRQENNRMLLALEVSLIGLLIVGLMATSIGIVNCLAMNVLEQVREFGLLRALGMTQRQLQRTVLSQALLIALVSVLLGTPTGLAISYTVDVAALPILGHAVTFAIYPALTLGIALAAFVVVRFAALLPAQRVRRLAPLDALRYE